MWFKGRGLILAAALAALAGPAAAQRAPQASPVAHSVTVDYTSGLVLACDRCEDAIPPASMSKLMTMLLVAEALESGAITEDTLVTVSERAWRHGAVSSGSHMFLAINSQVRVGDLIRGAIIVSANDACVALAEQIAGSEEGFVQRMNARAAQLGLTSARFRNATGLDEEGHEISPLDLARLAALMIREHPEMYALYREPSYTYNNRTQENRNPLLGAFTGADGVKTGHTEASGYGLIGSAVVDGQRRIIVFNGARSMQERRETAVRMMRAAFFDYTVRELFAAGEVIGEAEVWLGSRRTAQLVSATPIHLGAQPGLIPGLTASIVYEGPIPAPIAADQVIAHLVIEGPGFETQRFPLTAQAPVARANPFARALAGIGIALRGP
jgi:D-alanyl-D-alanine carboxypeptidase (penicillin-binding protein 5/6)